ncbi:pyridoxal-phosphate dependent enzyme, partial [Francisella tularensis subsp. holarctica]|uniref:pyridoxal-phosphate dependent enzyme n=1 Tax=Francisella tularensis TaxID=263 RepID=UPI002381B110
LHLCLRVKIIGKYLGINLYFKFEGKKPTGSFKDRGSAVDITVAKELGAKVIVLASTGNIAASSACYAAAAKMPCFIIVP